MKTTTPAVAGICLGAAIAIGVGSIPLFSAEGPSLDADWLRGLGLMAILMIPPILALIGLRRPGALLVAGLISFPMCLMSFSFLLFPLLIPAILYLVAFGRAVVSYTPRLAPPLVAALTLVLVGLSFFALFINEDPRCYEIVQRRDGTTFDRPLPADESISSADMGEEIQMRPGNEGGGVVGSGCSSDSVTRVEAGLSLGLLVSATVGAAYLSGPKSGSQTSLDQGTPI